MFLKIVQGDGQVGRLATVTAWKQETWARETASQRIQTPTNSFDIQIRVFWRMGMPLGPKAAILSLAVLATVAAIGRVDSAPAKLSRECLTPTWRSLHVYQALAFRGQPQLNSLGFTPAHIIDRGIWTDEKDRKTISPEKLRAVVARAASDGGLVVLDIEDHPLRDAPDLNIRKSVQTLAGAATIAREVAGQSPVGYYGLVPLSEYWRPLDTSPTGRFNAWRADNRRLLPIAAAVDINMPSLYTHYDDQEGWVRQAETLVCEARQMSDKPVVAFIWPEFHPGSGSGGKAVPIDYWRLQLDTLSRIADGVVIWGGYDMVHNRQYDWDADAPWWRETLAFMQRHRRDRSVRPLS